MKRLDNQAIAIASGVKGSPIRLNDLARQIRNLPIESAVREMERSRKKMASDVLKALKSAVANAEFNHGLDIDSLWVREAHVGKAFRLKRFRAKSRGRAGGIIKSFSRLTILLEEKSAEELAQNAPADKADSKKSAAKKSADKSKAKADNKADNKADAKSADKSEPNKKEVAK